MGARGAGGTGQGEEVSDIDLRGAKTVTPEEVSDLRKANALRPKESDFIGRPGYRRKYRPDGSYEWRYRFKPNDHGKLTREAHEVGEMLAPSMHADADRSAKRSGKTVRAALRDGDGKVRFVEHRLADQAAKRHGWSHVWKSGGLIVKRGLRGDMLWRLVRDEWEPTGKSQVGVLAPEVPCEGVQTDPDGADWIGANGAWRRI